MKSFLEHIFSNFELCKPHGQNCGTERYKVIHKQTFEKLPAVPLRFFTKRKRVCVELSMMHKCEKPD